jgi:two-component system, chemotaxis family, protein-glutamate methylesterase/glutaminase
MLSEAEKLAVLKLAEELTGASPGGDNRSGSVLSNVERRMRDCECDSWEEYYERVKSDPEEKKNLISALTIHTTAWFREGPHFVMFQELLLQALNRIEESGRKEPFQVWCAACSTGEEVYSFALVMEEFRKIHPSFDYRIYGSDVDPISIEVAESAIYNQRTINFNLDRYKSHLLYGSGKTEDLFTLSKEVRSRCQFRVHDLRTPLKHPGGPFDVVVCRNVLIYFSQEGVRRVVENILQNLKPDGHLMLGHSESVIGPDFGVTSRGHSVYMKAKPSTNAVLPLSHFEGGDQQPPKTGMFRISPPAASKSGAVRSPTAKPRILAVDDTKASRQLLTKVFQDLGFECDAVESTEGASQALRSGKYDLITLDLQMPGMEGGAWLHSERTKGLKLPVVIVSDVRREDAQSLVSLLGRSAQEYIEKSDLLHRANEIRDTFKELLRISQGESGRSVENLRGKPSFRPDLVAIGASTGGPQTLARLLSRLPADCPPVLVTQHISAKFASAFAERLEIVSGLQLGKIEEGEPLKPGHLYMALEDYHIGVQEPIRGKLTLKISDEAPLNRHRPSVDFLFKSIAQTNANAMGILLTGMGRDGAVGLKGLHSQGGFCIAQNQQDCIVYGMPREAINLGAAHFVGSADEIRELMLGAFALTAKAKEAG